MKRHWIRTRLRLPLAAFLVTILVASPMVAGTSPAHAAPSEIEAFLPPEQYNQASAAGGELVEREIIQTHRWWYDDSTSTPGWVLEPHMCPQFQSGSWVLEPCVRVLRLVELSVGPVAPGHLEHAACRFWRWLEGQPVHVFPSEPLSGARSSLLPEVGDSTRTIDGQEQLGAEPPYRLDRPFVWSAVYWEFPGSDPVSPQDQSRRDAYEQQLPEVLAGTWWVFWEDHWCGAPPEPDLPTAACSVHDTPNEPGRFQFDATESTGEGLVYEWDFGDGTTGSGFVDNHTYTTPGTYTVVLKVTDNLDRTATTSCEAVVAAPQLGVALSFPDTSTLPDGSPNLLFAPGDEATVRVHLKATDGVGPLTDVAFLGDPLRSAPTTAWEIEPGTEPEVPDDLALEPGEEMIFDVAAVAAQPGGFEFLSTVVAIDAAGRMVGPVELARGGRVGALDVRVVVEPAVVELEEGPDEEGPVPEPVTVTVKVTNPFAEPITNVVLSVNDPHLVTDTVPPLGYKAFAYLVPDPDNPAGDPIHGRPEDVELGSIPGGQTVEHEFKGEALARGDVELRVLAIGHYAGSQVPGAGTGELKVATDVLFVFDAEIDPSSHGMMNGEPWVDGGNDWRIAGSFENRTHDESFEVVVLPMREFNAGNGIPVPHLEPAIDDECAVGVVRHVEPGETIEWSATVHTSPTGTTRSQISYAPEVYVIGEDGERVPLGAEHVLVTAGSDEHLVRVDTRDHAPEVPGVGELLYTFSEAAVDEFSETVFALLAMGAEVLALGLQPWEWPSAYRAGSDRFVDYVVSIHENLSPVDRAAWDADWKAMVALTTGMALTDANNLVNQMALESFTELQDAWVQGDWETTAGWMGRQVGANPDVALGALVKAAGVCKLASQRTPWARNALAAKEARIAEELASLGANANATTFPTGAKISREHRRTIWGIDDAMHRKVQAFVDEFGISIGVRRRGPGSIAKIEAGTHNPKSFHNKAKNTTATDRDWLGFVDDLDTAAIKQPPPYSELVQRLDAAGLSRDARSQVLAQHKTRTKEWYGKGPEPGAPGYQDWLETGAGADFSKSDRFKWGQYAVPVEQGGGIPVPKKGAPLDYRDNVSSGRSMPSDDVLYDRAPARIRTVEGPDGRPQMILETDRGTGFKPDTGDMDALVVTKADLELLPEAKRLKFYERAHELGFEHVESASWNDVAGRNQYLLDHSIAGPGRPQGEAMHQWVPKGEPRATRFDPQRSWHDPSDELNAGRFFIHGTDVYLKTADPEPSGYAIDDSADYAGHVSPKSVYLVHPDCPGAVSDQEVMLQTTESAGSCTIAFDRGPDAVVLRQTDDGTNESWSETDGWDSWAGPVGDPVGVLPQSVLTASADAGASVLNIANADDLDLVAGVDEWFAVGDVVVIDPGGPNEERAIIGGFGSLILTTPLQHAHPAGTLVSVVQALGDPANPADPSGPGSPDGPVAPPGPGGPGGPGLPEAPAGPGDDGGAGLPDVSVAPPGPPGPGEADGSSDPKLPDVIGAPPTAGDPGSDDSQVDGAADERSGDGALPATGGGHLTLLWWALFMLLAGMRLVSGTRTDPLSCSPARQRRSPLWTRAAAGTPAQDHIHDD